MTARARALPAALAHGLPAARAPGLAVALAMAALPAALARGLPAALAPGLTAALARGLPAALAPGLAVALAIAALPAASRAEGWRGGGSLSLDLHGWQMEPELGDATRAVTAGPRVRAVGGKSALALAAGIDLQAGATGDGDFAYQLAVMPLGLGLQLGRSSRLGAVAGAGTSGITGGVLPIAFTLPVELFGEVSLGDHVRAAGWARTTALLASDTRQDGAADAPFGDELEIGLTLRWDRRRESWSHTAGNGYHLGATWGQRAGADVIGLIVGYALDAEGGE